MGISVIAMRVALVACLALLCMVVTASTETEAVEYDTMPAEDMANEIEFAQKTAPKAKAKAKAKIAKKAKAAPKKPAKKAAKKTNKRHYVEKKHYTAKKLFVPKFVGKKA